MKRILVLRFSALGDVVLTAPALEALRAACPEARILFAVKERLAPLVRHNPNVDEVVALEPGEGALAFAKRLRALQPDAVLDLHDKLRSKAIRLLLPRSARRAVWRKRDLKETLTVKLALRPYRATTTLSDRYHAAVEALVGRRLPRGKLRYWLGPDDRRLAEAALAEASVDPSRPLLGVSPGAKWATKRWPADRFADLCRRALAAGVQVAVQGSEDERALVGEVVRAAPGAVDLAGKLDLRALGGFISRCAAFVANDAGPMHLARGLGVPTLALFGSTDPAMFEWQGHRALFAGIECSPCSFFGRSRCPRGHFRCMLDLDAAGAWEALQPLLHRGPTAWVSA